MIRDVSLNEWLSFVRRKIVVVGWMKDVVAISVKERSGGSA